MNLGKLREGYPQPEINYEEWLKTRVNLDNKWRIWLGALTLESMINLAQQNNVLGVEMFLACLVGLLYAQGHYQDHKKQLNEISLSDSSHKLLEEVPKQAAR